MITFKQFLSEEIAQTKRKSIVHLQDMKPVDTLEFLHEIAHSFKGKLKDIGVSLKVDGLGARFGKDVNGKFFFETSNSGAIQQKRAFSSYTANKGGNEVSIIRAFHYDDIYDIIEESDLWKDLPNDTKVVIEILYNPMAEEDEEGLKFVAVKYDKAKLGEVMTIVPISVTQASSGVHHEKNEEIIHSLLKKSNKKLKVVSPDLKTTSIDIKAALDPLRFLGVDAEHVIKSLKHADKPQKQEYIAILNAIKDEVAKLILQHPIKGKDMLGSKVEGLVIEWNGKLYKVTEPEFKAHKKADKKAHLAVKEDVTRIWR